MTSNGEHRLRHYLSEGVMQCPSCLCSTSRELEINGSKFQECTYCENLMDPEISGHIQLYQELKTLRSKLKEIESIADRIMQSSIFTN